MEDLTIELEQAKAQLAKLIQDVAEGSEVVITRDG